MSFTSGNTPALSSGSHYHIDDQDICKTVCHRDLGILISGDISWSPHYDLICSRAYRMLVLMRRVFNNAICILAKKYLYTSLVRSQLSYCSIIWRPQLIKDIKFLENVQRCGTKYIFSDFSSDYRSRLISLNMLPLMMQFEFLIFFIKCLKYTSDYFNILDYVSFCSGTSRCATRQKLMFPSARIPLTLQRHFYFSRLPRLWNYLPQIDLNQTLRCIKKGITALFWCQFSQN